MVMQRVYPSRLLSVASTRLGRLAAVSLGRMGLAPGLWRVVCVCHVCQHVWRVCVCVRARARGQDTKQSPGRRVQHHLVRKTALGRHALVAIATRGAGCCVNRQGIGDTGRLPMPSLGLGTVHKTRTASVTLEVSGLHVWGRKAGGVRGNGGPLRIAALP